jgi:hypothetical protein
MFVAPPKINIPVPMTATDVLEGVAARLKEWMEFLSTSAIPPDVVELTPIPNTQCDAVTVAVFVLRRLWTTFPRTICPLKPLNGCVVELTAMPVSAIVGNEVLEFSVVVVKSRTVLFSTVTIPLLMRIPRMNCVPDAVEVPLLFRLAMVFPDTIVRTWLDPALMLIPVSCWVPVALVAALMLLATVVLPMRLFVTYDSAPIVDARNIPIKFHPDAVFSAFMVIPPTVFPLMVMENP